MKKVAVLLDAGFVERRLYEMGDKRHVTASELWSFAVGCATPTEEILRIFYDDSPPLESQEQHPISGEKINFAASGTAKRKAALHRELSQMNLVAFRAGRVNFDGWKLTLAATKTAIKAVAAKETFHLEARDVAPDIKQKRVDMMIGLDIAWLASKRLVDRLILVTADSDFVPAMKFARREGVQVVLVPLKHKNLPSELRVHADEVRDISFPGADSA